MLLALPAPALDLVLRSLCEDPGACAIRATCQLLRDAFDRVNTRLCLGGPRRQEQRPNEALHSFYARKGASAWQAPAGLPNLLTSLLLRSPAVHTITLQPHLVWMSLPSLLHAGGTALQERMRRLYLRGRDDIRDLAFVSNLPNLELLDLADCQLSNLAGGSSGRTGQPAPAFASCQHLTSLDLRGCKALPGGLVPLPASLQRLSLRSCAWVQDLTPLSCRRLTSLDLGNCIASALQDFWPLSTLTTLQDLNLEGTCIQSLAPLATCAQLTYLSCNMCRGITDLLGLPPSVRTLELQLTPNLQNLNGLQPCSQALQVMKLGGCSMLQQLHPLDGCTALQQLCIWGCLLVADLLPLAGCISLQELFLSHCPCVADLAPLSACTQLRSLSIDHCAAPLQEDALMTLTDARLPHPMF